MEARVGDRACRNSDREDAAMTEKIYWFVAAVFREIDDLAATLAKLRAHNVLAESLLILAAHLGDISEKLSKSGSGDVTIVTVDRASDGRRWISSSMLLRRSLFFSPACASISRSTSGSLMFDGFFAPPVL